VLNGKLFNPPNASWKAVITTYVIRMFVKTAFCSNSQNTTGTTENTTVACGDYIRKAVTTT